LYSIESCNINIDKLELEFAAVRGDLHLKFVRLKKLTIRGGSIGAISLQNSIIEEVDISSVKVPGTIEISDSEIGKFELSNSNAHALEVKRVDSMADIDAGFIVRHSTIPTMRFEHGKITALDLTANVSERVDLEALVLARAQVNHGRIDTLSLVGSEGAIDLGDSTIRRLKLGAQTAQQLTWSNGQLSTIEHEHGLQSLVANLRGQAVHANAFAALEVSLRSQGYVGEARGVHIQALAAAFGAEHECAAAALILTRLFYMDGHGHPVSYAFLLGALVMVGAGLFASPSGKRPAFVHHAHPQPSDGERLPCYEARAEPNGWVVRPTLPSRPPPDDFESDSAYNPVLMSLATLLPGDTLNYLRNYRFQPPSHRKAALVTVLQMLALLVQGLLVLSIIAVLGP
jgi:hypothetical protein